MSETITKYYSLGSALMQYGQVNGETNPNATTMQAMQAYMKQNGDTLGNIVESFLWQPSTAYVVNAEVKSPNLPAGYTAICTTAGTTGTIEPDWSTSYSTYTDGTVTWSIVSQKEQIAKLQGYDYVVDSGKSTDGTIWYRKWKSGWLEQGGAEVSYTPNFHSTPAVLFIKSYMNLKYSVNITATQGRFSFAAGFNTQFAINEKSVSGFEMSFSSDKNIKFNWYACGMGADEE